VVDVPSRYYRCFHTKLSNKKHKNWEDGIAAVRGSAVELMSTEGKSLAKATGYSISSLATLCEGATLTVNRKELEFGQEIPAEQFTSGSIFLHEAKDAPVAPVRRIKTKKNAFKSHSDHLIAQGLVNEEDLRTALVPRNDPNSEDAFVLYRPPEGADPCEHVPVVVDGWLSSRLRPHQKIGVQFLYDRVVKGGAGCILADAMGLGKTITTITLLWTLLKQHPHASTPFVRRAIIVVPSSLTKNWDKEITKWLGSERLRPLVICDQGKAECRRIINEYGTPNSKRPVLIISYDQFRVFAKEFAALRITTSLMVCDEGHRLKNKATALTKALEALPCAHRVILTGTPIQNDLDEFFSLLSFVAPRLFGDLSPTGFSRTYTIPIMQSRERDAKREQKEIGQSRAAKLAELTDSYVLRRTSATNNEFLPPKTETTVMLKLTPVQEKLYEHVLTSKELISSLSSGNGGAVALEMVTALRKVCNAPILATAEGTPSHELFLQAGVDPDELLRDDVSAKIRMVKQLLTEARAVDDRVVIVSSSTQCLDLLDRVCVEQSWPTARLDGSTTANKRQSLVDNFNRGGPLSFVFLLSTRAGGVGLNLVGANRLILFDLDWNPANDLQALARVWRDGQKKSVFIYRLVCTGTIEEKMFQRQLAKMALSSLMMGEDGQPASSTASKSSSSSSVSTFSRAELRDIFSYTGNQTLCDTHDLLGCDCTSSRIEGAPQRKKGQPKAQANAAELDAILGSMTHTAVAKATGDDVLAAAVAQVPGLATFFLSSIENAPSIDENDIEELIL
jgi:DNA repair and recombination protein RAD54B